MQKISKTALIATIATGALLLSACSGGGSGSGDGQAVTVSSANFVSSEIVGNIYAEALRDAGFEVETKFNVGSREAYVPALLDGSIDLIPDYTGNLLLYFDAEADTSSVEAIAVGLEGVLQAQGLEMLEPAPAEDKDALVVTSELAASWSLKSIGDLKVHSGELIVAGPPEFQERAAGLPGVAEKYGVVASEFVAIADGGGSATVAALKEGKVHAANIFTGSASIPKNNFVILEDPLMNFPSQNVVPVARDGALTDEMREVLNRVSRELALEDYVQLNEAVTGERKLEPRAAAIEWLEAKGLIG